MLGRSIYGVPSKNLSLHVVLTERCASCLDDFQFMNPTPLQIVSGLFPTILCKNFTTTSRTFRTPTPLPRPAAIIENTKTIFRIRRVAKSTAQDVENDELTIVGHRKRTDQFPIQQLEREQSMARPLNHRRRCNRAWILRGCVVHFLGLQKGKETAQPLRS